MTKVDEHVGYPGCHCADCLDAYVVPPALVRALRVLLVIGACVLVAELWFAG